MAIAFLIETPGGTQEQYDRVQTRLNLGDKKPAGEIVHIAGPTDNGWRIVDVWESQEAFDQFRKDSLDAAWAAEEMPEAKVSVWPVHNMLAG